MQDFNVMQRSINQIEEHKLTDFCEERKPVTLDLAKPVNRPVCNDYTFGSLSFTHKVEEDHHENFTHLERIDTDNCNRDLDSVLNDHKEKDIHFEGTFGREDFEQLKLLKLPRVPSYLPRI